MSFVNATNIFFSSAKQYFAFSHVETLFQFFSNDFKKPVNSVACTEFNVLSNSVLEKKLLAFLKLNQSIF